MTQTPPPVSTRRGLVMHSVQQPLYRWQRAYAQQTGGLWPWREFARKRARAEQQLIVRALNSRPAFVLVLARSVPAHGQPDVQSLPAGEYECIRQGTSIAGTATTGRIELTVVHQVAGFPRYTLYLAPEDIDSVYELNCQC